MSRRETPKKILDDRAFPVRIKVIHQPGLRDDLRLSDAEVWLRENVGIGNYAHHGQQGFALHAYAFYFRSLGDADRFIMAHPHYEIADSSQSLSHVRQAKEWHASGRTCGNHSTLGNKTAS